MARNLNQVVQLIDSDSEVNKTEININNYLESQFKYTHKALKKFTDKET